MALLELGIGFAEGIFGPLLFRNIRGGDHRKLVAIGIFDSLRRLSAPAIFRRLFAAGKTHAGCALPPVFSRCASPARRHLRVDTIRLPGAPEALLPEVPIIFRKSRFAKTIRLRSSLMITPWFKVSRTHFISSIHLCCVSFKACLRAAQVLTNLAALFDANIPRLAPSLLAGHTQNGLSASRHLLCVLCAVDEEGADGAEGG